MRYEDFLASKRHIPPPCGFEVDKATMNAHMFEWQKDIAQWALRKGRAALFEECGNGETIAEPVEVKCLFYMPTRRKVDLTNLLEAIDDILVYAGTLADDNSNIIVSHDGSRVLYDKENPRTEVYISRYE